MIANGAVSGAKVADGTLTIAAGETPLKICNVGATASMTYTVYTIAG